MNKINNLEYIKNIKLFFSCYFSFNGLYGRVLFWEALLFGYLIFYVFSKIQIPYFDILGWLGYFYISLNAYQKRCRNLRHPFPARAGCNVLLRGLAVFLKPKGGFLRAVHLPEFIKLELIFLHNQHFFIFNKEKIRRFRNLRIFKLKD